MKKKNRKRRATIWWDYRCRQRSVVPCPRPFVIDGGDGRPNPTRRRTRSVLRQSVSATRSAARLNVFTALCLPSDDDNSTPTTETAAEYANWVHLADVHGIRPELVDFELTHFFFFLSVTRRQPMFSDNRVTTIKFSPEKSK